MIDQYTFIDANGDGNKERKTTETTELYNKLSADEVNALRDKLNETVDAVNLVAAPLFPDFKLKFKASGNLDQNAIEVGDVVGGFYDIDTIWNDATYDGGPLDDKDSYTKIDPDALAVFDPELLTADGITNDFELPIGFNVSSLLLDRGERYKGTEWDQTGTTLTVIGDILAAGTKIYIKP